MFFIYGTRTARHSVGYVAEACSVCKEPTVCRIIEVSRGAHFFFIPMGRGSFPIGHEARCLTCRHVFDVRAVYYHGFGGRKKAGVEELIPFTSPWLRQLNKREEEEEWRFRRILDVFMRHDGSFRERTVRGGRISAGQLDWIGNLAVLMMLAVPMTLASLVMTDSVPLLSNMQATATAWIGSILAVIWGIYMVATEDRRFFRRHTVPRIHEELVPLGAHKSDWEAAMQRLKRLRFPTWKLLRSEVRRHDFPAYQEIRSPGFNVPCGEPDNSAA